MPPGANAGLCDDCRWCRIITSDRGSRFYRCRLSDTDARYPRFPRLPVLVCEGFSRFDDPAPVNAPSSAQRPSMPTPDLSIRAATSDDVPVILAFITQLAEYERLLDQVVATEARLRDSLFGARPAAEVLLAFEGDTPVGFALFFHNYSTFLAQRGIYLEDLFVVPAARGHGVGRQLLAALARLAVERGCGRLEWAVLEWNAPSIRFYKHLGAAAMDEWRVFRLTGPALEQVARG